MLSQNELNLVFRVLDANFNRAVEGMRAVEEFTRFVISNKKITTELKQLRHNLTSACADYFDEWANQRDSAEDVGAEITARGEYNRSNIADLVGANLARVGQALRSLEEYSKTACPEIARPIESVRYLFYETEKRVKRLAFVDHQLHNKRLYVLTSGCTTLSDFETRIRNLCEAEVGLIQLREKNLADHELVERAEKASKICKDFETLFIVNDRPDIAVIADADGIHVGQEELSVAQIRKIIPAKMIIGVSTHSLDQAIAAQQQNADYIGVGPTFPSHTKCFTEFKGPELLREVSHEIDIPAFAIGGINLENIHQVFEAGFNRVAVSNVIHGADSPSETISTLNDLLKNS